MNEILIPNGLVNARIKVRKIKQPHAPPELFKLHTLCGFIGMRGSGKTYAMVNLANKYLEEGSFTRVFIISPTYESNPIFHVLHAEDEDVYSNPNAATRAMEDILDKCKKDYEDYESYKYYMKAFNKWKRKTFTTR